MTVIVKRLSSVSAILKPRISFIMTMQWTLGLSVETKVCKAYPPPLGLLAPAIVFMKAIPVIMSVLDMFMFGIFSGFVIILHAGLFGVFCCLFFGFAWKD